MNNSTDKMESSVYLMSIRLSGAAARTGNLKYKWRK